MALEFRNTLKQRELIDLVLKGADAGAFIGLKDLYQTVSYAGEVSKQAIQGSMKNLVAHGYVERFTVGKRTFFKPTMRSYSRFRG